MNRLLIILAFCVCCSLGASAQGVLRWLQTEHDFGTFNEDLVRVECEMRAVNVGDSAVVIVNVNTTCGCTTSDYTRQPIAPGDTAVVRLTYLATGRVGAFEKSAFVFTNTAQRKMRLTITGNVLASENTLKSVYPEHIGALYMDSRIIPFGDVKKGSSKMAYIGAYNNSADTLQVQFSNVPKHVAMEAFPPQVPPFGLCTVSAFFNTFDTEEWGMLSDDITIITEPLKENSDVVSGAGKVTVVGTVNEDFTKWTNEQMQQAPIATLSDDTLDFGSISVQDAQVSQKVKITNTGSSVLQIRRVYSNVPKMLSIECSAQELQPGESAEIVFTVATAQIDDMYLNARVTVMTGDPIHPKQFLRLVGIVKKENK